MDIIRTSIHSIVRPNEVVQLIEDDIFLKRLFVKDDGLY